MYGRQYTHTHNIPNMCERIINHIIYGNSPFERSAVIMHYPHHRWRPLWCFELEMHSILHTYELQTITYYLKINKRPLERFGCCVVDFVLCVECMYLHVICMYNTFDSESLFRVRQFMSHRSAGLSCRAIRVQVAQNRPPWIVRITGLGVALVCVLM